LAEPVTHLAAGGRPLPQEIVLRADELEVAFTPRELRMVKETLGRSWSQINVDETDDDKFAVQAWLKLRRDGYDVELGDLDDVVIRLGDAGDAPDPTSGEPSKTSPPFATTGE
jgi:hypothetical protein